MGSSFASITPGNKTKVINLLVDAGLTDELVRFINPVSAAQFVQEVSNIKATTEFLPNEFYVKKSVTFVIPENHFSFKNLREIYGNELNSLSGFVSSDNLFDDLKNNFIPHHEYLAEFIFPKEKNEGTKFTSEEAIAFAIGRGGFLGNTIELLHFFAFDKKEMDAEIWFLGLNPQKGISQAYYLVRGDELAPYDLRRGGHKPGTLTLFPPSTFNNGYHEKCCFVIFHDLSVS